MSHVTVVPHARCCLRHELSRLAPRWLQGDGGCEPAVQVTGVTLTCDCDVRGARGVIYLSSGSCDQEIIRRAAHAALNDVGVTGAVLCVYCIFFDTILF
jgi:hypothetical protein